jgi:hypothetical protein
MRVSVARIAVADVGHEKFDEAPLRARQSIGQLDIPL